MKTYRGVLTGCDLGAGTLELTDSRIPGGRVEMHTTQRDLLRGLKTGRDTIASTDDQDGPDGRPWLLRIHQTALEER